MENDSASKVIGAVTKGNGSNHGLKRGSSTPSRTTHLNKKTGAKTTTTRAYNEESGMQETTVDTGSTGYSTPNIGGMLDTTVLILGAALIVVHLLTSNQGLVIWNALLAINKEAPKAPPPGDPWNHPPITTSSGPGSTDHPMGITTSTGPGTEARPIPDPTRTVGPSPPPWWPSWMPWKWL